MKTFFLIFLIYIQQKIYWRRGRIILYKEYFEERFFNSSICGSKYGAFTMWNQNFMKQLNLKYLTKLDHKIFELIYCGKVYIKIY